MTGTDPRDEIIGSYLRARARVNPPPELLDHISRAVAATPRQPRRSLFAVLMPAGAALAAAAALVALAVAIGQRQEIGPSLGPALTGSPSPTASLPASPSRSDAPSDELLVQGDTITMPAVDASGEWGRVILRRGADSGGYEEALGEGRFESDPNVFYLEIFVEYRADRLPEPAEFGIGDWHLRADDGTLLAEMVSVPSLPELTEFPGAVDVLSTPAQGWIVFAVPRSLEDAALELEYQPAAASEPEWTVPVREPGDAPEHVPPLGTPPSASYVARPGLAITVIESVEAAEHASVLTASTDWVPDEDLDAYVLNRAVLDRIMASIELGSD